MILKIDSEELCLLTCIVLYKSKENPQEINNLLEYLYDLVSEKFENDKK